MAASCSSSNVTVYVKPVTVMLCTSSVQLGLGHVNAPVTSPAVILSLTGSITIWPFRDGNSLAVVVSVTVELCGSTRVPPLLVHVRLAVALTLKLTVAAVLPTPPIVVPLQLTVLVAWLIVHTGSAE